MQEQDSAVTEELQLPVRSQVPTTSKHLRPKVWAHPLRDLRSSEVADARVVEKARAIGAPNQRQPELGCLLGVHGPWRSPSCHKTACFSQTANLCCQNHNACSLSRSCELWVRPLLPAPGDIHGNASMVGAPAMPFVWMVDTIAVSTATCQCRPSRDSTPRRQPVSPVCFFFFRRVLLSTCSTSLFDRLALMAIFWTLFNALHRPNSS